VAEDRAQPWEPYTRTLPAGAGPRFVGRIIAGSVMTFVSLLPVVLIAAVGTTATLSPARFVAAAGALVVAAVPFILIGLAIGDSMPTKAALAVAQLAAGSLALWAYRLDEGRRFR
jgi:ABC-2 type transport system permease protein